MIFSKQKNWVLLPVFLYKEYNFVPVKIKVEKIKTPEIGKIASSSKLVLLNELCFIKKNHTHFRSRDTN